MFFRAGLAALTAVVASTAFITATAAASPTPPPSADVLGLDVRRVDPGTRTVEAVQHCTDPATAGRVATFRVAPSVDFARIAPNAVIGARLDRSSTPIAIVEIVPPPCEFRPGGRPGGDPGRGPGGPGSGGPSCGPDAPAPDETEATRASLSRAPGLLSAGCEAPAFNRGFLSRVWRFQGEVDGFENGRLSYTIGKVLNLPKRMRDQDDELVDQDAIVLVGRNVRVWKGARRVSASVLDDANTALVHGKLLSPSKWQEDEDGEKTPTIRAKKINVTG